MFGTPARYGIGVTIPFPERKKRFAMRLLEGLVSFFCPENQVLYPTMMPLAGKVSRLTFWQRAMRAGRFRFNRKWPIRGWPIRRMRT
jgi:hypothetical protein